MPPAAAAAADDAHSGQKVKFCGYICQSFLLERDFLRRGCRRRRHYRLLLFSSGMDSAVLLLGEGHCLLSSFDTMAGNMR